MMETYLKYSYKCLKMVPTIFGLKNEPIKPNKSIKWPSKKLILKLLYCTRCYHYDNAHKYTI